MRIGRLRERLRRTSVEQEYYSDYTFFKAFGEDLKALIRPFDGKAFLDWDWHWQSDSVWHSHSINGLIPAALIDHEPEWRKETNANDKYSCFLTRFFESYDDIIVNCTFSLEGKWISDYDLFTVLETTRLKVEFKAETCEVLLPPGATILLSQLTLMQKLGENISVRKRERPLPTQVIEVFTSAKTPQELAKRLELKPIRLWEELEDKGEVMRR